MSAARIEALTALRDRLAKATGSDWQLSIDIELALNPGATYSALEDTTVYFNGRHYNPPAYTVSIDAAVTLVPSFVADGPHCLAYWDMNVEPAPMYGAGTRVTLSFESDVPNLSVYAPTPMLAICLARIEFELAKAYELAAIAEREA